MPSAAAAEATAAATRAGASAPATTAAEAAPLGTADADVSHLLAAGLPTKLCCASLTPVPGIERRGAWTGRRLRARNRGRRSVGDRSTAGTIGDRAAAGTVGDRTAAGTVCDCTTAGTVCDCTTAGTVCDCSTAGTIGDRIAAGTIGDRSTAGTIGDRIAAGTIGDRSTAGTICNSPRGAGPALEAAVIAPCRSPGVHLTEALAGRHIPISHPLPVHGVVLPGTGADRRPVHVDCIEAIDVDVDRAGAPVRAAPTPQPPGNCDTGTEGEARGQARAERVARRRRIIIGRIVRIWPRAKDDGRVV